MAWPLSRRSLLPPPPPPALPQRLPLATRPTHLTDFSTAALVDWARSTAAHTSGKFKPATATTHFHACPQAQSQRTAAGSLAALLLAALLLLVFLGWRVARCCTSCCCSSLRPRLLWRPSGADKAGAAATAQRILRGRGTRGLKAALLLCALSTLGSCIYGLTQTHTTLVSGTLGMLRQAQGLTAGALDAGERGVGCRWFHI